MEKKKKNAENKSTDRNNSQMHFALFFCLFIFLFCFCIFRNTFCSFFDNFYNLSTIYYEGGGDTHLK